MKQKGLLILAFLAPCFLCPAQGSNHAGAPVSADPPADVSAKPQPAADLGTSADTYVIGPSDVITVTVWKEPTLSGSILVRPDGMISLPLLGDVTAAGATPPELAGQLTTKFKKYIQDPNVSVVVTQINSKKIYLLGEVVKKGPVEMTPGMTLLEAIASAGGLTDYANSRKIYILREEGGKHQKIPVQYKRALKGNAASNVVLMSGDTIVVP